MSENNKKSIREHIGERIRKLRIVANLTQDEVAASLGISREAYIPIEKGRRGLKDEEILILADTLHTTTDYILTGNETPHIDICEYTGLSNNAIGSLRKLKRDAEVIPNASFSYASILYAIEKLLTTDDGNDLLREIGNFLCCDFTQAYSDQVDSETQTFSPIASHIGFKENGDLEMFHFYRPELFEQSALMQLMEKMKQFKYKKEPEKTKRVRRAKK